jgi:hypothetical protein
MRSDRPTRSDVEPGARYNSDAIAESLHSLELDYLALNPGASYRGLHDSIVNLLGNEQPTMLLCLLSPMAMPRSPSDRWVWPYTATSA